MDDKDNMQARLSRGLIGIMIVMNWHELIFRDER